MWLIRITKLVTLMLAGSLLLSLNGRWHYVLDNLSSFRPHFVPALLICCVVFLIARERAWLAASAIGLAVGSASVVPWYVPSHRGNSAEGAPTLKIVASNVSPWISDPTRLEALIRKEQPDIVGLIELSPSFLARLEHVAGEYPYRFEAPEEGFWGMALLSKMPLGNARKIHFAGDEPSAIAATLQWGARAVELLLVHPYPPMTADLAKRRDEQLRAISAHIAESPHDAVVFGDFNLSMWSPHYRDFVTTAKLENARKGYSIAPTWPSIPLLGAPIDHVLHTRSFVAEDFRVLPAIGSDHYPITAELSLAPSEARR